MKILKMFIERNYEKQQNKIFIQSIDKQWW